MNVWFLIIMCMTSDGILFLNALIFNLNFDYIDL